MLVAQHLDQVGDVLGALRVIDAAIEHTPTLIDLYMVKARVYKHGGNLQARLEIAPRLGLHGILARFTEDRGHSSAAASERDDGRGAQDGPSRSLP
jgi:hypothetical protein